MASDWDVRTRLVQTDAEAEEGAPLNTPLVLSTTFRADPEGVGFSAADLGEESPFFYARWSSSWDGETRWRRCVRTRSSTWAPCSVPSPRG
jgi:hypothetical protein